MVTIKKLLKEKEPTNLLVPQRPGVIKFKKEKRENLNLIRKKVQYNQLLRMLESGRFV